MLDAENTAFLNNVVTAIRYALYVVAACGALYFAFIILRLIWALSKGALSWLWEELLWPVLDSITYPLRRLASIFIAAMRWYRKRFGDRYAVERARKRMRDLGY